MAWAGMKKRLFGDYIQLVISSDDKKQAKKILKETYKEALRLQKIFNFYDSRSELSKLNKKRRHVASKELLEVLKEAVRLCVETKGNYDITQGKNFIRRKNNREIKKFECNYKDIHIRKNIVYLGHEDAIIDLSSIAKGYIADKLGDFLKKKKKINDFIVDARGDVLLSGKATPIIRIQHPRDQETYISTLHVKDAGIATSGDYEQYDKHFDNSHLLGGKHFASVTVIAPSLMQADAYATVLSTLLSKKQVKALLAKNKKIAVMTISKKMKKEYYNNFRLLASSV